MRIYVKRENWDGGLWLELPASDADAQQLLKELAKIHPSVMLPFIGEIDSQIKELGERLAGELIFENGHLEMFNRLASCTDEMESEDLLLFAAAVEMEKPESIEQVLETMGHLDSYELRTDIRDMDGLGRYVVQKEGEEIPTEIEDIFDYGRYASLRQQQYGCFTEGGFVERRQPEKEHPEADGAIQRKWGTEAVFTVEVKKQPYGYESFSLPMTEKELAETENRIETAGDGCDAGMRVLAVHDGLFETLPPGSTIGELNQAAVEIKALMDKGQPDWNLLLAALEAELPETMEDACRIIRNCADYEFLPLESIEPEDYAKYIMKRDGITIPPSMQPCIKYHQFGRRKLEETRPVKTFYGVVINRVRPIQPAPRVAQSFRLFNPLTITSYGGPGSIEPEILSGQEAVSMQEDIRKRIVRSLKGYGDSGLAESLSNCILARKIRSMRPDVEEYEGELWGVLEVDTVAGLTEREKAALTEEWRVMAGEGWGEQLSCMPIRAGGREVHIGFWDTENGSGLFIRPGEELLGDTGRFEMKLQ